MGERAHREMVSDGTSALRVVMIGAGNLATNLGRALHMAGHDIVQVFSRTQESASRLASLLGAEAVSDLNEVFHDADAYIIAVKDSVLEQVVTSLCKDRTDGVFMHTAGSMPMNIFEGHTAHGGVLYPMQTFSKDRAVDFAEIPFFLEATDDKSMNVIRTLAESVSHSIYEISSEERRYLHLAAVFACNFANHCYAMSAKILEEHDIPFSVMLPLIDETARKVHVLHPHDAQTGPAVRFDENVIRRHLQLLKLHPELAEIYELLSKDIHQNHTK